MMSPEGFNATAPGAQPDQTGAAQLAAVTLPLFPVTSRYHGIPTAQHAMADGRAVTYLRRRFIPPPYRFQLLREYVVSRGDRIDNVSAEHLGDASQYWRVCDANAVMRPEDLERVGRRIRITMPEGIPGSAGV